MEKKTEFLAAELDRDIVQEFKKLVKSNGYTQKFVLEKIVKQTIRDFKNHELNNMGGLFNAEKRD